MEIFIIQKKQKGIIGACLDKEFSLKFSIGEPPLWTPENPNLCTLSTKVFVDNILIDEEDNNINHLVPEWLGLCDVKFNSQKSGLSSFILMGTV